MRFWWLEACIEHRAKAKSKGEKKRATVKILKIGYWVFAIGYLSLNSELIHFPFLQNFVAVLIGKMP